MSSTPPLTGSVPKAFEWSFDRRPFDTASDRYTTFSVGIFQWLPKAAGQGFKKSKTIRVLGYVSAPFDVYQKATELCQRLNREKIRWDQPPAWLQSQYSVSRPATEPPPPEPEADEVDARKFRQIRKRVFKELLEPLGYDVSSTVAAKLDDGVVMQIIEIQFSTNAPSYTINFGQHFSGLPATASFFPGRERTFDMACTYLLNGRLHHPEARGMLEYGDTVEKAEARFRWLVRLCLDDLEKLRRAYPDIETMRLKYSPEQLLEQACHSTSPETGIPLLSSPEHYLAYDLAAYTGKIGDNDACRAYIKACRSIVGTPRNDWFKALFAALDRLEAGLHR